MKLDLWRALGVTAAAIIAGELVNMVVYAGPSYPLSPVTADSLSFAASLVVVAVVSVLYFKNSPVRAGAGNGFLLGLVIFTYTFASGFMLGYTQTALDTMLGLPGSVIVGMSLPWLPWASALSVIAVPSLVGWFMAKKRN